MGKLQTQITVTKISVKLNGQQIDRENRGLPVVNFESSHRMQNQFRHVIIHFSSLQQAGNNRLKPTGIFFRFFSFLMTVIGMCRNAIIEKMRKKKPREN